MTPKDLKVGYVVENRIGQRYMVLPVYAPVQPYLVLATRVSWSSLSSYDDDFKCTSPGCGDLDIMRVYGLTHFVHDAYNMDPRYRPLLWERKEPKKKKMTVSQICEVLGYDVEIVKEEE